MIPYLFTISRKSQQNRENPVTADMTARETFERELRPLEHIKDNYEKTVLTLDLLTPGNYNGIRVVQLIDWLLHP